MKVTEKQRKEVRRHMREFRRTLYLHLWTFNVSYMDSDGDDDTAAHITCQSEYLQGRICVYPRFWTEKYEDRRKMLLHELVHAVLSDLQKQFRSLHEGKHVSRTTHGDIVEKTTVHLTNIIFDLL
jgi:hypothetical protein